MLKIILMGLLFIVNYAFCQDIKVLGDSHITKMGGLDNLKKILNVSIEQMGYSNNYEIPQSIVTVKDASIYQETTYPNGKHIVVVNNNNGWEINPFVSTTPRDLTSVEIQRYNANISLFGPLYDFCINGVNSRIKEIIIDGEKEIDKDLCYKLNVTYKNNISEFVYISKKNYMIRKIENSFGTIQFSNYKKVNNVMFSFNSEMKNKLGIMTIDVLKIKANVKLSPSLFKKP